MTLCSGLGNAVVAQLIHALNDNYDDWRETTLFLSGILSTITVFGALFRPVQFTFHLKKKNYHHTMHDTRLPPSCMTSMEKLQRFINEMDKQCAQRHAHQSVSLTASNNERASGMIDDADAISVANESDLFDSYSADDITEIQQDNSPKIDMLTFREKISNDMTFINERWKKITKRQVETGNNSKLFRMPNFRYLISTKTKDRNEILMVPFQTVKRDRQVSFSNEQKHNGLSTKLPCDENVNKSVGIIKSGLHVANYFLVYDNDLAVVCRAC
jgi:hypothetical protein